jgi:hypothetical protein
MAVRLHRGVLLAAALLLSGCGQETLFQSDFDQTPAGQPPAHEQKVGTAGVHGPAGSVVVVAPPVTPSGQWVRISRPAPDSGVASFQGSFAEPRGAGEYVFTATLLVPSRSGAATIQFEPFGQPVSRLEGFLHIDLMPDGTLRIDDQEDSRFGTFPHDQPFVVQVTLHTAASPPKVHVVLSGAGASGTADREVLAPFQSAASQFGAVRLWMGVPHTGSFDATHIVVKRKRD